MKGMQASWPLPNYIILAGLAKLCEQTYHALDLSPDVEDSRD